MVRVAADLPASSLPMIRPAQAPTIAPELREPPLISNERSPQQPGQQSNTAERVILDVLNKIFGN